MSVGSKVYSGQKDVTSKAITRRSHFEGMYNPKKRPIFAKSPGCRKQGYDRILEGPGFIGCSSLPWGFLQSGLGFRVQGLGALIRLRYGSCFLGRVKLNNNR